MKLLLSLEPGGIEVFHVDLDGDCEPECQSISAEEQARAERYATPLLTQRCRASRAALRMLLSRRHGVDPRGIRLATSEFGKPILIWPAQRNSHFNVSHTGRHALIALASTPVGIDVETVRPDLDIDSVAAVACHVEEREWLRGLPELERTTEFHRLWTRKEAYAKALGCGLSVAPDLLRFERSGECREVYIHRSRLAQQEQNLWAVREVPAPAGCVASLCHMTEAAALRRVLTPVSEPA